MPALPADRVLFATDSVTIGAFRCATEHPSFRDSGPIQQDCFVFPRTAVVIAHCDARPFVADPTIVTLYNRAQRYERRAVSREGDRCDWFAVSHDVLRDALVQRDRAAADSDRPIRFTHAASDAATYLEQRRVFTEVLKESDAGLTPPASCQGSDRGQTPADPLDVEERVVALLDRVLDLAYCGRPARTGAVRSHGISTAAAGRASGLADAAKRYIAPRAGERLTLARVAAAAGCSVFHLCRSFRHATGLTLHEYREQVRVRLALERIGDGERDLSRLALDLGYSSHSHFTASFRRAFGAPPSSARALLRGEASF